MQRAHAAGPEFVTRGKFAFPKLLASGDPHVGAVVLAFVDTFTVIWQAHCTRAKPRWRTVHVVCFGVYRGKAAQAGARPVTAVTPNGCR